MVLRGSHWYVDTFVHVFSLLFNCKGLSGVFLTGYLYIKEMWQYCRGCGGKSCGIPA